MSPMSVALSMFKDAKLDELVNVYSKSNQTEKQSVYELLYPLYPTERERLDKIKEETKISQRDMLKRLTIDNFALINHIDVAFDDGLSIITGETGAGKSIIIGALSLLLGSRADSKSVKDRNEKMVVEAVFDIGDYDLRALFESYGLDYFPEETIVRRELLPSGRSRAFINDMPVQLATLSELTLRLVDIHSQHSNALLLKPAYQLAMLDDLSGNGELLKNYREAFQVFQNGKKAFEAAKSRIEKNKSDEEYFRFQLNQLETANLKSDEQEALEKSRMCLKIRRK